MSTVYDLSSVYLCWIFLISIFTLGACVSVMNDITGCNLLHKVMIEFIIVVAVLFRLHFNDDSGLLILCTFFFKEFLKNGINKSNRE